MGRFDSATWKINGSDAPVPVSWEESIEEVTTNYSGKATLDGTLHKSVIRTRTVIMAKYGLLTATQKAFLDSAFTTGKATVTYPSESGSVTKTFSSGSRSVTFLTIIGGANYYKNYSLKLTEV